MSPILGVQKRFRELGRIRMGMKTGNRPIKLDKWRLTSRSAELLEKAAEKYGGTPQMWSGAPGEATQYELVTEVDTIDIIFPPGQSLSQWFELWSGGGCQRRCDGQRQVLRDVQCSCPVDTAERMELAAKGKACKPTSRLNVILPEIPDMGVWLLETHGYHAAAELAGAADITALANKQNRLIPARLRLEKRTTKKTGQPAHHFAVPVIVIDKTMGELFKAIGATDVGGALALTAPPPVERKALPGGSAVLPTDPSFEIEEAEPAEQGSMPGAPPPPAEDVVDAEVVVQNPCPHCGAECLPWNSANSKAPKWRCTNADCKGNDDGDAPWVSWHNDPWKPGGQIETEFGSAGTTPSGQTASPSGPKEGGQPATGRSGSQSVAGGGDGATPVDTAPADPSSGDGDEHAHYLSLIESALESKDIMFKDVARTSAMVVAGSDGLTAPTKVSAIKDCKTELLRGVCEKLNLDGPAQQGMSV